MDTSDGRSERRLVDAAADALAASGAADRAAPADRRARCRLLPRRTRPPIRAGAGSRSSNASARSSTGTAPGRWPRCPPARWPIRATEIVEADLVEYVNETSDTYDALCLDIDNGPGWTVTEGNDGLYRTVRTGGLRTAVEAGRGARRVVRTALSGIRRNLA
ncbi:Spermidine synthase OS=Streptomyces tendae OX=1932 GN=GUR47_14445 PE=4 SV=1 [Streptomyces tendae]